MITCEKHEEIKQEAEKLYSLKPDWVTFLPRDTRPTRRGSPLFPHSRGNRGVRAIRRIPGYSANARPTKAAGVGPGGGFGAD